MFLEGCAIEEAIFNSVPVDTIEPFLRIHEKSLKKLSLTAFSSFDYYVFDMLAQLKGLNLETLELFSDGGREKFSVFARNCPSLKHLMLLGRIVNDLVINVICDNFKELESLKLIRFAEMTSQSTDNLHKLTHLKLLEIKTYNGYDDSNLNPLNGLRFVVNENLEELEAPFNNIRPEFIAELKSAMPNLKKLNMQTKSPKVIAEVMKHFKNLEHLTVFQHRSWQKRFPKSLFKEKVMLRLKYLRVSLGIRNIDTKMARRIVNNFCNLEFLRIDCCYHLPERFIKILLRGLKSLKELYLMDITNRFSANVLAYVKIYGKKLQKIHLGVNYDFHSLPIREILADMKGLQISGTYFHIVI